LRLRVVLFKPLEVKIVAALLTLLVLYAFVPAVQSDMHSLHCARCPLILPMKYPGIRSFRFFGLPP